MASLACSALSKAKRLTTFSWWTCSNQQRVTIQWSVRARKPVRQPDYVTRGESCQQESQGCLVRVLDCGAAVQGWGFPAGSAVQSMVALTVVLNLTARAASVSVVCTCGKE